MENYFNQFTLPGLPKPLFKRLQDHCKASGLSQWQVICAALATALPSGHECCLGDDCPEKKKSR